MEALEQFPPNRASGLARLERFAPKAGTEYRRLRARVFGPGCHAHVSTLSPYIRHRLVTEEEVLKTVLDHHSRDDAAKFVDELFWRTYNKGWLEMRPSAWDDCRAELSVAWDDVQTQGGLRRRWEEACLGRTGIACFDAWAHELVETGYLHNHARMWFASIWLYTLDLPLALGQDFFLRHLCDGDPASNTLGWRWVAGLHTPGKTYLAEPAAIRDCTEGRFDPEGELAREAKPVDGPPNPERNEAPQGHELDRSGRVVLLLHEDDLSPGWMFDKGLAPVATGVIDASGGLSILQPAEHVTRFKTGAIEDCLTREADHLGPVTRDLTSARQIEDWAKAQNATRIVTLHPPVGPVADIVRGIDTLPVTRLLRDWDRRAWPYATAGFFKFRSNIPELIAATQGVQAR
ncbi:DNA photolyase [Roseivivax halodurans JCM 10272]|uniref:DNA photolyase n=1 Tax=Roseivivax halodurans JCM 10272 TaxID=1449350 RepID=X7EG52_9RHOB|nr:FAD-binding domain-containing protein [Roseivivax halodurans]ETX14216.1 DNA photolyase [Roseivivax halodurans JCM 10272]